MERKNNMMRPLHIIMPMAGEGSRFRKEGWTTPKPLIELNEMPLFVRAIQSVAISDVRMKSTGGKSVLCRENYQRSC